MIKDAAMIEINADPTNTFTVGHNKFSTWTDDEYKAILGYRSWGAKGEIEVLDEVNVLLPKTGEMKMLSLKLKIRDNVDHAGHSQQLVRLKVLMLLLMELSIHTQSNN